MPRILTVGMTQAASILVRNQVSSYTTLLQSLVDSYFPLEDAYLILGYREKPRVKKRIRRISAKLLLMLCFL